MALHFAVSTRAEQAGKLGLGILVDEERAAVLEGLELDGDLVTGLRDIDSEFRLPQLDIARIAGARVLTIEGIGVSQVDEHAAVLTSLSCEHRVTNGARYVVLISLAHEEVAVLVAHVLHVIAIGANARVKTRAQGRRLHANEVNSEKLVADKRAAMTIGRRIYVSGIVGNVHGYRVHVRSPRRTARH